MDTHQITASEKWKKSCNSLLYAIGNMISKHNPLPRLQIKSEQSQRNGTIFYSVCKSEHYDPQTVVVPITKEYTPSAG